MAAVTELATDVGTRAACRALFAPRASYYRDRRAACFPAATALRPRPARALSPVERETVLAHLHGERFQDCSPAAVYATLLDEGHYYCSIRSMHRFLKQEGESRERRDQLTHPPYKKPELLATAPISSGAGTSPSCWGPPSGPTSTSTSSSMSSAATSPAGWWRCAKARSWPSG